MRSIQAEFEQGSEGEVRRQHGREEHPAEEVEPLGEEVVVGEGGEEGVPGDGVPVGTLVEHQVGMGDVSEFGVEGDEFVGEEAVGDGAGGDEKSVGALEVREGVRGGDGG